MIPVGFTITVENLSKRFNREWIFRNLSYSFERGKTYAITGPNGSGKSTLMQILWGQLPPTAGTIRYSHDSKVVEIENAFRYFSIATPYMDLIDEFTLDEQLGFHFKMRRSRNGQSKEEMLEAMYLQDARHKYISNFSSGMKQRLKLALALFTETEVIFLDEPGTNLDQKAFDWYWDQLNRLPKECLVFIASNQSVEYPSDAVKVDIMTYK